MRTTCTLTARYVGADLTDAYARRPREIDVCGLEVDGDILVARFWRWTYDGGTRDVGPLLAEIQAARGAVLDGPQALARVGATMRESERMLGAAGKTPSAPPTSGPFSGFVRTSVELFAALDKAGVPVSASSLIGGVGEQYPGGNWRHLAGPLPPKKEPTGIAARRALLEGLGVRFPTQLRLTDDHLDACLGAVIAAAADHVIPAVVPGASVERKGSALVRDGEALREGPILLLTADPTTQARLRDKVAPLAALRRSAPPASRPSSAAAGLVCFGVTSAMVEAKQDAIAVTGLAQLKATRSERRKVALPELEGHLWLGDTTCVWFAHQDDATARATYARIRMPLAESPDDFEDLEAHVADETDDRPPATAKA